MKKITLIATIAVCFVGYMVISAYRGGPALVGGYDCTGAESGLGNPTGCFAGGGCHSSAPTSNILLSVELDSSGTPVTHYIGGASYTVKISGTNNTASNLIRFGFQVGCIKGSTQQVTPTNAGTWPSPYPASVHYSAPQAGLYVVGVVEQSNFITPTTGTGGNGSTYVEVINWKAPVAGTGTVSFWAAMNCVNGNTNADAGDLWDVNHIVINEYPLGVNDLVTQNNGVKVYPNPFSLKATFSLDNEVKDAQLSLYDITGREVKQMVFSGKEVVLDRDELNNGIYFYRIVDGDKAITGRVIIQ